MESIGFIGLGIMGKPMAAHLMAAGHTVSVHNRSPSAARELATQGATIAETPAILAAANDVIITMLPDSPDVERVVFGNEGVAAAIRPGSLFIDMSTIAPATSRRIAAALIDRGVDSIDAPVSGGQAAAQAGSLSIMAGGSETALARAQPIFDVVGKTTTHIGPPGAGQVAKAANQIVVALTIQAVAEALVLARKAGVDPARVRGALLGGLAQSRILEVHGQRMLEGTYDPGFRLRLHRKDLAIALQLAREELVPLFATAQAAGLMDALLAQGAGDLDHSATVTLYEQLGRLPDAGMSSPHSGG